MKLVMLHKWGQFQNASFHRFQNQLALHLKEESLIFMDEINIKYTLKMTFMYIPCLSNQASRGFK